MLSHNLPDKRRQLKDILMQGRSEEELWKRIEDNKKRGYILIKEPTRMHSDHTDFSWSYNYLYRRKFLAKSFRNDTKWMAKMRYQPPETKE